MIPLLKVTLLHGCFSSCLNCTNDTKSRKPSHNGYLFCLGQLGDTRGEKWAGQILVQNEMYDGAVTLHYTST